MPTYTRRIEASLLTTGLTTGSALGYTVVGVGGATLVARATAGVTEDGSSANYYADVAGWDAAWSGTIVWDAGAGTLARESFLAYTPQTGDSFARIGAPTGVSIAADIATRSTYAGGDTAGTTTLLTRIPGTVQPQTGDAYARLGAPSGASISADIQTRSTYAGADTSGTTTLLSRLSSARAGYLDALNGHVAQTGDSFARIGLAGAGLTALGDARLANLDVAVSTLTPLSASGVRSAVGLGSANLDTQLTAIDDYLDTEVAAIKAVTDKLNTALALSGSVYQFTVNALANAPAGGGGGGGTLSVYERAFLTGKVVVQSDGSWWYYDPDDDTVPVLQFTRLPSPGGRAVTRDPA